MSDKRIFTLSDTWYSEDGDSIFKTKRVTIRKGITILVGCNGYGKTTFLKQLKSYLNKKEIPVFFFSNYKDGEAKRMSKAGLFGDYEFIARILQSSEGENIVSVLEQVAREMGQFTHSNPNAEEMWFLLDALDSGLSIDNIVEVKENLMREIIKLEDRMDVYFVVSTNTYEFAKSENCFDVGSGKYMQFKNYDEYREFVLNSRAEKEKRYDK